MNPLVFIQVAFGTVLIALLAYVIVGQHEIHVLVNSQLTEIKNQLAAAHKRIEILENLLAEEEKSK